MHTLLEDEERDLTDLVEDEPRAVEEALDFGTADVQLPSSAGSLDLFLNEIGRYPLLTAAEEVVLAKAVERGDQAAKERMVNSNLRLVVSIAKRYRGRGVPFGDLIQDGVIGLNRAVGEVRPPQGIQVLDVRHLGAMIAPPRPIASTASWVESITPRRLRSSIRSQWSAGAAG